MDSKTLPATSRSEARLSGQKRFFTGTPCKRGHVCQRSARNGSCIDCENARNRIALLRAKKGDPARFKRYEARDKLRNPIGRMFQHAKTRAKKRGTEFTIKKTDILMGKECPCCGRDFLIVPVLGPVTDASPSLDRLDSKVGYVPGNVAVICYRCNILKRDATASELRAIADWMDGADNVARWGERRRGNIILREVSK